MSPAGFIGLAVETATELCTVAACRGPTLVERELPGGPERSRHVYTQVAAVLQELELQLADLQCVAFGQGPGSFTGLRVAAAVAQGLGRSADRPVCAVSSLAALALQASTAAPPGTPLAVCLDARMGQVYAACYQVGAGGPEALLADCLADPAALLWPGQGPLLAAGPGWAAYPELARNCRDRLIGCDADLRPRAGAVLRLAGLALQQGRVTDAAAARPNYLRDRVAVAAPADPGVKL